MLATVCRRCMRASATCSWEFNRETSARYSPSRDRNLFFQNSTVSFWLAWEARGGIWGSGAGVEARAGTPYLTKWGGGSNAAARRAALFSTSACRGVGRTNSLPLVSGRPRSCRSRVVRARTLMLVGDYPRPTQSGSRRHTCHRPSASIEPSPISPQALGVHPQRSAHSRHSGPCFAFDPAKVMRDFMSDGVEHIGFICLACSHRHRQLDPLFCIAANPKRRPALVPADLPPVELARKLRGKPPELGIG